MPGSCAACGGGPLEPHLRVSGSAGGEGLIPTTTQFGVALSDIVRCMRCGHMQLAEFPAVETLLEGYAEAESADYLLEETGQRATAQGQLRQIERLVAPGRLLDLGCWTGFLLDEARLRGWSVVGVEPSEFASSFARERLGLDVITSDLFTVSLDRGSFDAVVLGDVIEHLPDPGAALDHVASLIRPGGVLQLALPDAGSRVARMLGSRWWSVIPTHVQYFTRRSLITLLATHDWRVLEIDTAPKAFTVNYYLGRIGGYSDRVSRALQAVAKRLRIADKIWAPDFRDRMTVVAGAPRAARSR
jgi:SAM-dependent methyltransferase